MADAAPIACQRIASPEPIKIKKERRSKSRDRRMKDSMEEEKDPRDVKSLWSMYYGANSDRVYREKKDDPSFKEKQREIPAELIRAALEDNHNDLKRRERKRYREVKSRELDNLSNSSMERSRSVSLLAPEQVNVTVDSRRGRDAWKRSMGVRKKKQRDSYLPMEERLARLGVPEQFEPRIELPGDRSAQKRSVRVRRQKQVDSYLPLEERIVKDMLNVPFPSVPFDSNLLKSMKIRVGDSSNGLEEERRVILVDDSSRDPDQKRRRYEDQTGNGYASPRDYENERNDCRDGRSEHFEHYNHHRSPRVYEERSSRQYRERSGSRNDHHSPRNHEGSEIHYNHQVLENREERRHGRSDRVRSGSRHNDHPARDHMDRGDDRHNRERLNSHYSHQVAPSHDERRRDRSDQVRPGSRHSGRDDRHNRERTESHHNHQAEQNHGERRRDRSRERPDSRDDGHSARDHHRGRRDYRYEIEMLDGHMHINHQAERNHEEERQERHRNDHRAESDHGVRRADRHERERSESHRNHQAMVDHETRRRDRSDRGARSHSDDHSPRTHYEEKREDHYERDMSEGHHSYRAEQNHEEGRRELSDRERHSSHYDDHSARDHRDRREERHERERSKSRSDRRSKKKSHKKDKEKKSKRSHKTKHRDESSRNKHRDRDPERSPESTSRRSRFTEENKNESNGGRHSRSSGYSSDHLSNRNEENPCNQPKDVLRSYAQYPEFAPPNLRGTNQCHAPTDERPKQFYSRAMEMSFLSGGARAPIDHGQLRYSDRGAREPSRTNETERDAEENAKTSRRSSRSVERSSSRHRSSKRHKKRKHRSRHRERSSSRRRHAEESEAHEPSDDDDDDDDDSDGADSTNGQQPGSHEINNQETPLQTEQSSYSVPNNAPEIPGIYRYLAYETAKLMELWDLFKLEYAQGAASKTKKFEQMYKDVEAAVILVPVRRRAYINSRMPADQDEVDKLKNAKKELCNLAVLCLKESGYFKAEENSEIESHGAKEVVEDEAEPNLVIDLAPDAYAERPQK